MADYADVCQRHGMMITIGDGGLTLSDRGQNVVPNWMHLPDVVAALWPSWDHEAEAYVTVPEGQRRRRARLAQRTTP